MTVFIVVALVGAVLLVLSLVLDGVDSIFDVMAFGDGMFSMTAIGSALTLGGAIGAALTSAHTPWWLATTVAVLVGVAIMSLVGAIVKRLKKSMRKTTIDVVGARGVTTAITSGQIGEVMLDAPGELNKRLAISDGNDLPLGTPVVVVAVDGSRVLVRAENSSWNQPPPPGVEPSPGR